MRGRQAVERAGGAYCLGGIEITLLFSAWYTDKADEGLIMARIYYVENGPERHRAGKGRKVNIDDVPGKLCGHKITALGTIPPELQTDNPGHTGIAGSHYVVIEVGPEEICAPDFLDRGFYLIEGIGVEQVAKKFRLPLPKPAKPAVSRKTRDLRGDVRVGVRIPVRFINQYDEELYDGWIQNLSRCGMYVTSSGQLPVETRCLFQILQGERGLPSNLFVTGLVMHTHGDGMGIQFVAIEKKAEAGIQKIVGQALSHT